MKKTSQLDIPAIFASDATDLLKARETAIRIHGTDIRAAGNEVEETVRSYFRRMLPNKYYVTHGHIVDFAANVSPQLDIIITDNLALPSLMTTKDGTEYIPIESVYAIGEIKSTYYKSHKYIEALSDIVRSMRTEMQREDIPNTAYGGITPWTNIRDATLGRGNRILNQLFSFLLCLNSGDFRFDDVLDVFRDRELAHLPNLTVLLDKGVVHRGSVANDGVSVNRYPEWPDDDDEQWLFCPYHGLEVGTLEGNHLGLLYFSVIEHLNNSLVEPAPLWKYGARMMAGRKSTLIAEKALPGEG